MMRMIVRLLYLAPVLNGPRTSGRKVAHFSLLYLFNPKQFKQNTKKNYDENNKDNYDNDNFPSLTFQPIKVLVEFQMNYFPEIL